MHADDPRLSKYILTISKHQSNPMSTVTTSPNSFISTTQWLVHSVYPYNRHNIQSYTIPNGAPQHRLSTASYFVINSFLLIIILLKKEQQRLHYILNPINIIKVLTLCVWNKGFLLFETTFVYGKQTDCLWRLANLFSDPQLIPDVKRLPHKIMTSR